MVDTQLVLKKFWAVFVKNTQNNFVNAGRETFLSSEDGIENRMEK